jgi:hypothetical protein
MSTSKTTRYVNGSVTCFENTQGDTALHLALKPTMDKEHNSLVLLLIMGHADKKIKNKQGKSPKQMAKALGITLPKPQTLWQKTKEKILKTIKITLPEHTLPAQQKAQQASVPLTLVLPLENISVAHLGEKGTRSKSFGIITKSKGFKTM